jgi:hypothetical protein
MFRHVTLPKYSTCPRQQPNTNVKFLVMCLAKDRIMHNDHVRDECYSSREEELTRFYKNVKAHLET